MAQTIDAQARDARVVVLGYSGVLAAVAGYVNSVALLVWVFPVGNLTALTTQVGMHSTNPLLYSGRMIAVIVVGFLAGVMVAGVVLAAARSHTGPRHAAVLLAEAVLLVAAAGFEHPLVRAPLAAAACGLQNGMTSGFPGMAIRTTHFTGTITDLGLLVARGFRHGVDKWKAAVLTTTVVLFVAGAAVGVIVGGRLGDHALIPASVACVVVAVASIRHDRRRRTLAAHAAPTPEPADSLAGWLEPPPLAAVSPYGNRSAAADTAGTHQG
ncbi:YoaK family protein [Mycobacterium sp.]|uniref:YoaK family protein n=1 Tax=Mycobacterium sp. TaxID=1785 RepID=UPI0025FC7E52|nr:YoaK family protein [Mycobacterium sp.]